MTSKASDILSIFLLSHKTKTKREWSTSFSEYEESTVNLSIKLKREQLYTIVLLHIQMLTYFIATKSVP